MDKRGLALTLRSSRRLGTASTIKNTKVSLRKTLRERVVSVVVLVRRRVQRQPCDPLGLPVRFVGFLLEMRSQILHQRLKATGERGLVAVD